MSGSPAARLTRIPVLMIHVDVDGVVAVVMGAVTTMIVLLVKRSILLLLLPPWLHHEADTMLVAGDTTNKTITLITTILMSPVLLQEARVLQQMDRLPQYYNGLSRIMVQAMVEVVRMDHISHDHRVSTSNLGRTP